jgi:16S rRNA (cytosine967-C5)-methyltransferase
MNRPLHPQRGLGRRGPQEDWTGRRLAFSALFAFETNKEFVGNFLDELFHDHAPAPQERAMATEIAFGCVRRMITLDALLEHCVSRPRETVEDGLWVLLRMGIYQLIFMPGLAVHAAVHETVELAEKLGMPRWKGMINAALRQAQRGFIPEIGLETAVLDDLQKLTEKSLVLGRAEGLTDQRPQYTTITLREPIAPPPRADWTQYLARTLSFPEWIIGRWRTAFGDDEALRIGVWFNSPNRLTLRVNPLRSDRETILRNLRESGVECEPGELPETIQLKGRLAVEGNHDFRDGRFTVQDSSAIAAGAMLGPRPGERVWDICSAPGGKTTHLAEQMRNEGSVLATDIYSARLGLVTNACERLGITNVAICLISKDGEDAPTEEFDAILLDAPCSNSGVLGKRPEARWRISPGDLQELVPTQKRLLQLGLSRLKPGGRLVYSTCSIEPDENSRVVQAVLSQMPGYEFIRESKHIPGKPADGGYQALIHRSGPSLRDGREALGNS